MPIRNWAELLPYFILKRLVKAVAPTLIMCGDQYYAAWEFGEKEYLIIPYEKWKEKEKECDGCEKI